MIKLKPIHFLILILQITQFSCVKEYELEQPNISPTLVVNSLFTPDDIFRLNISKITSIYDTNKYFIDNAFVELYNNNHKLGEFFHIEKGNYVFPLNPETNTNYEIKINVPNYKPVKAKDKIPEKVKIKEATFTLGESFDEEGRPLYNTNISFLDPANIDNYYELIIYEQYNLNSPKNYNSFYNYIINDPVLIEDSDLDYEPTTFFFSDNLFNGKQAEIDLKFSGGFGFDSNNNYFPDKYFVILRSVSKAYYNYRKYWTRHIFNQNIDEHVNYVLEDYDPITLLFQGEPLTMYTNIENGYGIFAGYTECVKEIRYINTNK